MTLLEIRTQFVKLSGRYDLVLDAVDFVDKGANFYINAAIHMLEKLAEVQESKAKLYYDIAASEYSLTFQHNCRLITEVWCNDAEKRTPLMKISLKQLKTEWYKAAADEDTGIPAYFALAGLRALETTDKESLGTFIDVTNDETDTNYDYRGIVIVPPADGAYTIEVSGLFKNVDLSADGDENFWTIEESDLLLRAALYKLEAFSRGTENAKNWLSAIRDDVFEINKDVAEEESYGVTQREG